MKLAQCAFLLIISMFFVFGAGCSNTDERPKGVDASIQGDASLLDAAVSQPCSEGALQCDELVLMACRDGAYSEKERCASACSPDLGCVVCLPGTGQCDGDGSRACKPDGSGYVEEVTHCDPLLGVTCGERGVCEGPCSPQALGKSYAGCEYYPVITSNVVRREFEFAVVVVNDSGDAANIHIDGSTLDTPLRRTIGNASVEVIRLPWDPKLKGCISDLEDFEKSCGPSPNTSALVRRGAFHLKSDRPVVVYQFSPLDFRKNIGFSYTNDASLLLPVNSLGDDYIVASYPDWKGEEHFPGEISVVATEDNTVVTVKPNTYLHQEGELALRAFRENEVTLNQGDVLQLLSRGLDVGKADLTGSRVRANKPIQVLGAHYCTEIPNAFKACDHIEESMFPVAALDNKYLIASPATTAEPAGRKRVIRVIATEDDTNVVFDPPLARSGHLRKEGEFLEVQHDGTNYAVSADKKIMVAEYMIGQQAGGDEGDPAMLVSIPQGQYRTAYTVHAPQNYSANFINVTMPMDGSVSINGQAVGVPKEIGSSGFGVVKVRLASSDNGNYRLEGSKPFGVSVYGYGRFTSYWYAGGLDFNRIVIE